MSNLIALSPLDAVRFLANAKTILEKMGNPSVPMSQIDGLTSELRHLALDEQVDWMSRVAQVVLDDHPEMTEFCQQVVARKATRGGETGAVQAIAQLLGYFSDADWKDIALLILALNLSGRWKLTIGQFTFEKESILPNRGDT
ncbi:MAG: hypothetical protein H7839_11690 [Magnetococcus sp. YQC-5]